MKPKVFSMDSVTIAINQNGIRLWIGTTELPYEALSIHWSDSHLIIKTNSSEERESIRRNLVGLPFIRLE